MKYLYNGFRLTCFLIILTSCEKEDLNNLNFNLSESAEAIVSINISEIGGNDLKLVSSRFDDSPLIDNTFNTLISKEGEQLLLVIDESDELRALTLSTPLTSGGSIIPIGVNSTAIALVFLSPGISTLDPEKANLTIERIEDLFSFIEFKKYLESNLRNKSLNEIIIEEAYVSLLTDCLEEYSIKYIFNEGNLSKSDLNDQGWFSLIHYGTTSIEARNYGFRFVSLVRQDYNIQNVLLKEEMEISDMKGGIPFSWGSVLTWSFLDPTTKDIKYYPALNTNYSEFWVVGAGLKKSIEIPSQSIKDVDLQILESVTYYVVLPFLDLYGGAKNLTGTSTEQFKRLIDIIKIDKSLVFAITSDNREGLTRELMNMAISIIGTIAHSPSLKGSSLASFASKFLGITSAGWSATNLIIWGDYLFMTPTYFKFIKTPNNSNLTKPILVTPINNANDLSLPVKLSWNRYENAIGYSILVYGNSGSYLHSLNIDFQENNSVTIFNLLSNTDYYWKIKPYLHYNDSEWSDTWTFKTQTLDPNIKIFNKELSYGSLFDIEKNVYKTIKIGNQTWMAENLRTTKLNDNTSITLVTDQSLWINMTSPGYCWANNDIESNGSIFGALYNYYTVNTGKLCPMGWHVPSLSEFQILINFLGGLKLAGGKLKEYSYSHWEYPYNIEATNESGFTALPGGFRNNHADFMGIGINGLWWSTTLAHQYPGTDRFKSYYYLGLLNFSNSADIMSATDFNGLSVRCVKDN